MSQSHYLLQKKMGRNIIDLSIVLCYTIWLNHLEMNRLNLFFVEENVY